MQRSGNNVERAYQYLKDRFGVSRDDPVLDGLALREESGDIWLASAEGDTDMSVKTQGIRFIRVQEIGLKPTTYALQFLNDAISKNIVELSVEEVVALLAGEHIVVDTDLSQGYMALVYAGRVIGCGLYRNGTVSSRIPKGRAQELRRYVGEEEKE